MAAEPNFKGLPALSFDGLLGQEKNCFGVRKAFMRCRSIFTLIHLRRPAVAALVAVSFGVLAQIDPSPALAQTNIAVGSGPVLAVAAIQLAVAKDYFKEEGLNVTLTPLSSGAATLAALTPLLAGKTPREIAPAVVKSLVGPNATPEAKRSRSALTA
jgi:hypothetical protein